MVVREEATQQTLMPLAVLMGRVTWLVYAESMTFGFCVFRDSEDQSFWVTSPTHEVFHLDDAATVYHDVGLIAANARDWCLKSGCL